MSQNKEKEKTYFNNNIYDKDGNINEKDASVLKKIVPPSGYLKIKNKTNKTLYTGYVKDDTTSPIELGRNISDNYIMMENLAYYLRKDTDKNANVYYKKILNTPTALSEFENDLNISGYIQEYVNSIINSGTTTDESTYSMLKSKSTSITSNDIEYFSNDGNTIYTDYSIITKGDYIFRKQNNNTIIEKTLKLDIDNETLVFDGNFSANNLTISGDLTIKGDSFADILSNINNRITQLETQINDENKNN